MPASAAAYGVKRPLQVEDFKGTGYKLELVMACISPLCRIETLGLVKRYEQGYLTRRILLFDVVYAPRFNVKEGVDGSKTRCSCD